MLEIVVGSVAGRKRILRRPALDDTPVPPAMQTAYRTLFGSELTLAQAAARLVRGVRDGGDAAIRCYASAFGDALPDQFRVDDQEFREAVAHIPAALREALQMAAERLAGYHQKQRRAGYIDLDSSALLGQLVRPIDQVAIYAPGGGGAYPSSILMGAIPAKVAGCHRVVLASPLRPDAAGRAVMLAAAQIAGVDEVYQVGGAPAIGALAYGTETIPAVDKIVGPGSAIVVLAMREVYGQVGIGSLPGPSEALILADDSAPVTFIAADMLTQPEHGPDGITVLLTTSLDYARAVDTEMERQVLALPRATIIRRAYAANGGAVVLPSIAEALAEADRFAPEHLQLCVRDAMTWLPAVGRAGAVFIGPYTPVPLGDYAAGTNHILPVLRMARFSSPLGVDDFVVRTSVLHFGAEAFQALAPTVLALAEAEGFSAHAAAVQRRLDTLAASE
ncbi:MAG: histidinol dehydrogenase [Chloroflexota bacterium]